MGYCSRPTAHSPELRAQSSDNAEPVARLSSVMPTKKTPHHPVYLDSPAAVDTFLGAIAATPILALDTEGASFHRFVDRIYLLQLSTRDRTAVIDPLPIGSPAGLGRLAEDPSVRSEERRVG